MPTPNLTKSELLLIRALGDYWTLRAISEVLGLSYYTTKHKLSALLDKTGCENRFHLAIWAIRHGYLVIEREEPCA